MATDILERFASIVTASLDNVAHCERLKQLGMTDSLTGLANRRYFDERLREEIMRAVRQVSPLRDAHGETGTNVGGMVASVRGAMAEMTDQDVADVHIQDLLAVDTHVPVTVRGGLADEVADEIARDKRDLASLIGHTTDELAARLGPALDLILNG